MRVLVTSKEAVKLDLIDRKILYLLSINARFSYSTISKHVNLSREAVKQRISKLISDKVILGFRTLINAQKLGFSSFHVFLQSNNPKKENETKLVNGLVEDGFVNAVLKYNGKFDYEVSYILKDIKELNEKVKKISLFDLKDYDICSMLSTITSKSYPKCMYDFEDLQIGRIGKDGSFYSDFLKQKKSNLFLELDDLDYKILSIICDDARISMVDLSSKVASSVDTVIYRIKKMIDAGIILEFRPVINYAALGFSVYCVFFRFKNFSKEKENEFLAYVKEQKNLLWSSMCIGRYSNISYIIVKDAFDFQDVLSDIRERFFDIIDVYELILSFAEYKYTYFPEGLFKR